MRNLYRRIGLAGLATQEAVATAIGIRKGRDLDEARFVLLNTQRKRIYDRNYAVLATIGALRRELGLTHTASWQIPGCQEFTPSEPADTVRAQAFKKASTAKSPHSRSDPRRARTADVGNAESHDLDDSSGDSTDRIVIGVGVAGFAVLLIAGVGMLFNGSRRTDTVQQAAATSETGAENKSRLRAVPTPQPAPAAETVGRFVESGPTLDDLPSAGTVRQPYTQPVEIALPRPAYVQVQPLAPLSPAPSEPPKKVVRNTFDKPQLPLPFNGWYRMFSRSRALAPFKVQTPSAGGHHFIKLVDQATQQTAVVLFVREGSSAEISVPLGTYAMRYASGAMWYGEQYLFGPETRYHRTDDEFTFERESDGYSGVSIELIKQVNGNLSTEEIDASSF